MWTVESYMVELVFLKCTKMWLLLKVGRGLEDRDAGKLGLGDVGREHAWGLEDVEPRDWRT